MRTIDKEFLELDKQTQKLISKHERNIKKNYKKALDDLRKQVADLYEKYGDADGKLSLETMNKYARLDNLKKSIQDSLNEVYRTNKQEIYTNLKEVYKLNSEGVVKPLEKSISYLPNTRINFEGILKTLDVAKTINEEMAGLNWAERLGKHRADVIYNVEKTVREGLYNGDTYKTMATRLKDSLEGDVINPTRIVRTEGARVMSTAQTDVLNKVADKVPMKKIWLSANDERTRDTHIAMHKKEVDYEDVFILPDGTEMFAPLQGGNAKNVINCRCVMSIRIAEETEGKAWKEPTPEPEVKEEVSTVIKFKEAKNIQEANEYAQKELGIKNVDYKGVDVAVANEWNKGLADNFARFPELKNAIRHTGTAQSRNNLIKQRMTKDITERYQKNNPDWSIEKLNPYIKKDVSRRMRNYTIKSNTMAQSWSPGKGLYEDLAGVTINKEYGKSFDNLAKTIAKDVKSQFHPAGTESIRSLLDHEIGHQLDDMLGISKIDEIKKLYDSRTYEAITKDLSTYSWKNNNSNRYGEMIAEGWSEYVNNPEPREMAKIIGETIEREYKKKFKK